jgi:L-alanine-DL-glutamate epimerase-like enolase superfamily enzyme
VKIAQVSAFALQWPAAGSRHEPPDTSVYGHYHIARRGWTSIYSDRLETCVLRIQADDGTVGWGEGQAPVSPRTVKSIVEDLCTPVLLGADPFDVEYLWYRMYSAMRERGHATGFYVDALAGVDLALYDLLGRSLGVPAHKLLGGRFRDRVPVYAGIGGNTPDIAARAAATHVGLGYRALKLHLRGDNPDILRIAAAVRLEAGEEIELMVDVHGTRDVAQAIQLGRGLEALGCRWLEAPTLAEDLEGHSQVARALDMQVATGEWLRTAWEWRGWIQQRAFDAAMPDIARTGLTEGKRIAGLLDSHSLPVAPHVGGGGILSVAASVQFSAAIPNFQILEHSHGAHSAKARIATSYPQPVDGAFPVTAGPGLDVEIDEAAVRSLAVGSASN